MKATVKIFKNGIHVDTIEVDGTPRHDNYDGHIRTEAMMRTNVKFAGELASFEIVWHK